MSLTAEQVEALLRPIKPQRVMRDNNGMAHVSQQDIRAHLTRMFGFGGWSSEIRSLDLVAELPVTTKGGKDAWAITYRAMVRLTIRDPQGAVVASYDDVGTGTSPSLPSKGDAHDFACKVAVSIALKRAATNLGDGFGLSLYNKGQMTPLVIDTLVKPTGAGRDASEDVPAQESLGHDDQGSAAFWPEPTKVPKTDDVWLQAWCAKLATQTHKHADLLPLWAEMVSKHTARDLTDDDRLRLEAAYKERSDALDLRAAEAEASAEPRGHLTPAEAAAS